MIAFLIRPKGPNQYQCKTKADCRFIVSGKFWSINSINFHPSMKIINKINKSQLSLTRPKQRKRNTNVSEKSAHIAATYKISL